MISADQFWPTLDALGEEEVRRRLAQRVYGQQKIPLVQAWLARRESEHAEAAAQRQEIRANEALRLSAEGNSLARGSKAAAWVAVVISALALVVAMAALIMGAGR